MISANTLMYALPAFLIGIVLHEFAHAYVAWKLGDPTGKLQGRLSLNPLVHLDPLGTLMLFFAGIGWANPVPINISNFRHPRRDMAMAAGAGPVTNLFIAAVAILAVNLMPTAARDPMLMGHGFSIVKLLVVIASINAMLAVFNLIPVRPLDGHHFLEVLLPPRQFLAYKQNELMISIVALVLLMSGALSPLFNAVQNAVYSMCLTSYWGV